LDFFDPDAQKFLILGSVTISVWILSRLVEWGSGVWTRLQSRKAFLRALFAEIDLNTKDLEIFVEEAPDRETIELRVSDLSVIPHITDARHTQIYNGQLHSLHSLDNELIREVVTFYASLDKILSQINGISQESYKSISVEGRVNVMIILISTCADCAERGIKILDAMHIRHGNLKLERHKRAAVETTARVQPLKDRLTKLSSELDRIGSTHSKTPSK